MAARNSEHTSMLRIGVASLMAGAALGLAGCTAEAPDAPVESAASASSITDEMTCTAFGDVLTIAANADAGLRDERMAVQEQQGWYRLAARVLDRVPTSGSGAVSDAVVALKKAAPASPSGAMAASGVGSEAWNSSMEAMSTACSEAGFELGLEMFTGG